MNTITVTLPLQETWNRLDSSRREIITQLFGTRGKTLLNFLLATSTSVPDQEHVALVPDYQLGDSAGLLGWSLETMKCYIATFTALNFIQSPADSSSAPDLTPSSDPVACLSIPLGPYEPPSSLDALHNLCTTSKRQRQLAEKVRDRYLHLFDGSATSSRHCSSDIQMVEQGFTGLEALLVQDQVEPLLCQELQGRISQLLQRCLVLDQLLQERQQLAVSTTVGVQEVSPAMPGPVASAVDNVCSPPIPTETIRASAEIGCGNYTRDVDSVDNVDNVDNAGIPVKQDIDTSGVVRRFMAGETFSLDESIMFTMLHNPVRYTEDGAASLPRSSPGHFGQPLSAARHTQYPPTSRQTSFSIPRKKKLNKRRSARNKKRVS